MAGTLLRWRGSSVPVIVVSAKFNVNDVNVGLAYRLLPDSVTICPPVHISSMAGRGTF